MTHIEGSSRGPLITHYVLNPAKKSSSHALIYRMEKNIVTSMKKTLTVILLALTLSCLGAATVYIGGEGGLTLNSIIAGKGYGGYEYNTKASSSFSIPVVVEFTPSFGLQTGVSFVTKSYDYTKTVTTKGVASTILGYTCSNSFIEVPVAFRYSLTFGESRWGAFFTAGGFAGFWAYGNRSGQVTGFTSVQSVDEDTDLSYYNRFQAGVSASLGVECEFGKCDAYLSFGYALTLTNLNRSQKYDSFPVHNSTMTVAAGIMWGVNR